MEFSDVITLLAFLAAGGAGYLAVTRNQAYNASVEEITRLKRQSDDDKSRAKQETEQNRELKDKCRRLEQEQSLLADQAKDERSKHAHQLEEERNQYARQIEAERNKSTRQVEEERKRLEQEKREQFAELRKIHEEERQKLRQQAIVETVYTVIVDGPSDAGKSSLIYKLMNPGGDIASLEATHVGWESPLWPVIFDDRTRDKGGPRDLYCIKAHDIAGEAPFYANDLAGQIDAKRGVIIIVVDILQLEEALSRFTSAFIKAQYFTARMLEKVDSAIVYVNKIDRSGELYPEVEREQIEHLVSTRLRPVLETLNQRYPGTKIIFGSAKTEENLFKLLAEIHRSMHIAEKFPNHPSIREDSVIGLTRTGRA
jgi:hypothetical protein